MFHKSLVLRKVGSCKFKYFHFLFESVSVSYEQLIIRLFEAPVPSHFGNIYKQQSIGQP